MFGNLSAPLKFEFPFDPYDIQHDFMVNLYNSLEQGKLGIFESPTGTGKSLSIICGAIRWLKDHQKSEREKLDKKIENYKNEIKGFSLDASDWFTVQSKEIEITQLVNSLTIEQNKIKEYDKKLADLKAKKNKISKYKTVSKKEEFDDEKLEDCELLPEIFQENAEESSDEAEDENKYEPTKIYICSRTHSQLGQFLGEISKSSFAKDIRVTTLASRQVYCTNPNVNKLKNMSLINDRCLDLQKNAKKSQKTDKDGRVTKKQRTSCKCEFFKQQTIDDLKAFVLNEVVDVEDLLKKGNELKACPYYATRYAAEFSEIVLVPYNTILHKSTREANGIKLKNSVVIIDEAHNLLEAMAQMYSAEVSHKQIHLSLEQLKAYKQRFNAKFAAKTLLLINQLIFILTRLLEFLENLVTNIFTVGNFVFEAKIDKYNMFQLVKFCKESRIAQKIRGYIVKYPNDETEPQKPKKPPTLGLKNFLSSIENKNKKSSTVVEPPLPKEPNNKRENFVSTPLVAVISFLETLKYSSDDGRILTQSFPDKSQNTLRFLLLNPSADFKDIIKEARSVIVTGGTMKPISEFKDRLFINSGADPARISHFSCSHIVSPENILPIVISEGPNQEKLLFNYQNRLLLTDCITRIIQECCVNIPGGVVVFFPSYNYENFIWGKIKDMSFGRPVFREPQESSAVEGVLKKYAAAIKKPSSSGALLLSVVGGKLSEGLNFSDDLGRCVVIIGMPYANITSVDLKEKMSYLDKKEGGGAGKIFYENLCMKSVNQSIGRAVRHKNDYATILLVDERYSRNSTQNALPDWIKRSLKNCKFCDAFSSISEFFQQR